MKRPKPPHVPVRDDARTTWSPEEAAERIGDGAGGTTRSRVRADEDTGTGLQVPAAGSRRRQSQDGLPPLPGSPRTAPPREKSELDPATATARAEGLLLRLAAHDPDTVGHLRRTAATVEAAATRLGWDAARVRWTTFGALLHDVGKMNVAPEVTFKPGPLSESEQAAMRDHVVYGTRLVSEAGFPPMVARIVHDHHERLDGSGYPSGLRGREIDEEVRLVMLADIADAMLSRRAYKEAMSLRVVREALQAGAGILFDADLIGPVVAELERREAAT